MNNIKNHLLGKLALGIILLLVVFGCNLNQEERLDPEKSEIESKIRQVHADYVDGWKNMDESKIMGLFEEDSQIQPNRFNPVIGKENIREFWFPRDSSETIINEFTTEIISLTLLDTIALTTHSSILDWDYKKDATNFGMYQKGINTTIYRKQKNGSWKIWRSMWSDLYSKSN
jgi:ketosteroid isomerase-like protein